MRCFSARAASIAIAVGLLVLFASACGSDEESQASSDPLQVSIAQYRSTLEEDAENLAVKTAALANATEVGELSRAQSRYATSRVRYSQMEPLAEELFPTLDLRVDAYIGEVAANEFGGFHRIEKALWAEETLDGIGPVAKRLAADVEELRRKIGMVELQPVRIATGAAELIGEIPAAMIARREEPYADCDLVDVAANVEGAEAAFKAVQPLLAQRDPKLTREIEGQFGKAYAKLGEYGTLAREPDQPRPEAPGAIFVVYDEVSEAEIRQLAEPIEALGEQLSQVPDLIISE